MNGDDLLFCNLQNYFVKNAILMGFFFLSFVCLHVCVA